MPLSGDFQHYYKYLAFDVDVQECEMSSVYVNRYVVGRALWNRHMVFLRCSYDHHVHMSFLSFATISSSLSPSLPALSYHPALLNVFLSLFVLMGSNQCKSFFCYHLTHRWTRLKLFQKKGCCLIDLCHVLQESQLLGHLKRDHLYFGSLSAMFLEG